MKQVNLVGGAPNERGDKKMVNVEYASCSLMMGIPTK